MAGCKWLPYAWSAHICSRNGIKKLACLQMGAFGTHLQAGPPCPFPNVHAAGTHLQQDGNCGGRGS